LTDKTQNNCTVQFAQKILCTLKAGTCHWNQDRRTNCTMQTFTSSHSNRKQQWVNWRIHNNNWGQKHEKL